MSKTAKPFFSRSKVWIEDDKGNMVFGMGRLRILKAIKRTGSINAAAKELKMGYRAVWGRISATEERLGAKLLEKKAGGSTGGGSELTPLADALIEKFNEISIYIEQETDALFQSALGSQINLQNAPDQNTPDLD